MNGILPMDATPIPVKVRSHFTCLPSTHTGWSGDIMGMSFAAKIQVHFTAQSFNIPSLCVKKHAVSTRVLLIITAVVLLRNLLQSPLMWTMDCHPLLHRAPSDRLPSSVRASGCHLHPSPHSHVSHMTNIVCTSRFNLLGKNIPSPYVIYHFTSDSVFDCVDSRRMTVPQNPEDNDIGRLCTGRDPPKPIAKLLCRK